MDVNLANPGGQPLRAGLVAGPGQIAGGGVMKAEDVKRSLDYAAYYYSELPDLTNGSGDQAGGQCPFQKGNPHSFSINLKTGLFRCHTKDCNAKGDVFHFYQRKHKCDFTTAVEELGKFAGLDTWNSKKARKPRGKIFAAYDYHDAGGKLIFQVVKFEPKDFRQRRPNGKDWIWDLKDIELVPFNLPEVLKAETVHICEGEKDCLALSHYGLTATCNPMGAGRWQAEYNQYFQGKQVVILPDNDPPGRDHAQEVARNLHGIAASVKVVELPDLPPKGDVSNWLQAGGTPFKLLQLAKDTPEWQPPAEPKVMNWEEALATLPFTAADFAKKDFTPPKEAMKPGINRPSINIVLGEKGTGKTLCGFEMAQVMGEGIVGMDGVWSADERFRVLYLDGELPGGLAEKYADAVGLNSAWVTFINRGDFEANSGLSLDLGQEEARHNLEKFIGGFDVIFLDNVFSLFGVDLMDPNAWRPINQWLMKLRAQDKIVNVLAHPPKSGDTVFGTIAQIVNVDLVMQLRPMRAEDEADDCAFSIKILHSRYEARELEGKKYRLPRAGGGWSVTSTNPQLVKLATVIQMHLAGKTQMEINARVEVNQSTVSRWLERAEGKYLEGGKMTAEGRRFIETYGSD
jgi:hypothetical protein